VSGVRPGSPLGLCPVTPAVRSKCLPGLWWVDRLPRCWDASQVEVIQVGRIEVTSPAPTLRFPELPEELPEEFGSGRGCEVSNT